MTSPLARHLVLQHGWNSAAYQILNPGIRHWFSRIAPAVAGFVTRGNTMIIAGGPICDPAHLPAVTRELESHAHDRGQRTCYFAAGERLARHFQSSDHHAKIALGAQPVWNPQSWPAILKSHASLRAQIARAKNKSVHISIHPAARIKTDPHFRRCLNEWLASRPLPPLHFLTEPQTCEGELADRLLFVAHQNEIPIAYLLASPVPSRNGFLAEQILRSHSAPNGTAELLIDALMHHLANTGSEFLTLGLAPLCQHANPWLKQNPLWLRAIISLARTHGRRFYSFDGLENFRTKLCPAHWEPIYAISNEKHFSPRSFYALLAAFSEKPLPLLALQSFANCLHTESTRVRSRLHLN